MTPSPDPLAEDPGQQPPRRLRLPISAALVAGFGGLMLVALTTVMAIGLGVAGRNTLELLVDKATLTLDLVTDRVESRMNPVRDQADFLAEEIANGTLSPERPTELARTLRLALAATPQVTGIAFTTPDFRTIRVGRLEGSLDTLIGDAPDHGKHRDARPVHGGVARPARPVLGRSRVAAPARHDHRSAGPPGLARRPD